MSFHKDRTKGGATASWVAYAVCSAEAGDVPVARALLTKRRQQAQQQERFPAAAPAGLAQVRPSLCCEVWYLNKSLLACLFNLCLIPQHKVTIDERAVLAPTCGVSAIRGPGTGTGDKGQAQ